MNKGKLLDNKKLLRKIFKNLSKLDKSSFLEKYAVFMGKTQVVELELKNILINKFKYGEEKIENMTLGGAIIELGKNGLRTDFIFLLEDLLKHRNSLAHEFLGITARGNAITGGSFERLQYKELRHALWKVEEVIQVYDWINENGRLFGRKSKDIGKKILVFTEGTIIYHANANGKTREEIIGQVKNKDKYVHQYSSYIPIEHSVNKLKVWYYKGIKILYLTSRKKKEEIESIKKVLKYWDFPKGELYSRKENENYKDVAERVKPDILIEDDCESIGGEIEMTYPHISEKLKKSIKSIIVKEFEGIDNVKI
ncbi:MAG: hypothetical protein WCW04_03210 [Candidatus Paceibacterota bacterium]